MTARQFQAQFGNGPVADEFARLEGKAQIRLPKKRGPNKTEAEWIGILERRFDPAYFRVLYERVTLHLPSGTRYTPDAVVMENKYRGAIYEFWEVKGPHIHNSASIRAFKEARAAYPLWSFRFAQKTKGGWAEA